MKKFLLAFSVVLLMSCSKKESDQNTNTYGSDSLTTDSLSTMPTQPSMSDSASTPASGTDSANGRVNNTSGATTPGRDSAATSTSPNSGR